MQWSQKWRNSKALGPANPGSGYHESDEGREGTDRALAKGGPDQLTGSKKTGAVVLVARLAWTIFNVAKAPTSP